MWFSLNSLSTFSCCSLSQNVHSQNWKSFLGVCFERLRARVCLCFSDIQLKSNGEEKMKMFFLHKRKVCVENSLDTHIHWGERKGNEEKGNNNSRHAIHSILVLLQLCTESDWNHEIVVKSLKHIRIREKRKVKKFKTEKNPHEKSCIWSWS